MYIYIYIYLSIYLSIYIYIYIYMYVCMYVYMYVCMYVCLYVCMYVYISFFYLEVIVVLFTATLSHPRNQQNISNIFIKKKSESTNISQDFHTPGKCQKVYHPGSWK